MIANIRAVNVQCEHITLIQIQEYLSLANDKNLKTHHFDTNSRILYLSLAIVRVLCTSSRL